MTLSLNPGNVALLHFFDPHAGEVFKQHPTWTHLMVSDHGRIWSDKSRQFVGVENSPRGGSTSPNRYIKVTALGVKQARDLGRGRTEQAHVLVLETFVGPRPSPEHDADHINHDSLDNRLSNLQWITKAENQSRRRR